MIAELLTIQKPMKQSITKKNLMALINFFPGIFSIFSSNFLRLISASLSNLACFIIRLISSSFKLIASILFIKTFKSLIIYTLLFYLIS